ncbi:MAG: hypothetical protein ACP5P4_05120 [Steroidobacteraceae bacterium]
MGTKISALPAAAALTGVELVPLDQGGVTSQSTPAAIVAYTATVTNEPVLASYAKSAAETAATVAPVNYSIPSDVSLVRASRYSNSSTWDYRTDQRLFELYLSKYGAVFNGTTDDSAAINDAITALGSLGGYRRRVIMPEGGLTALINSGITIPTGQIGIDFNGLKINASGITTGNVLTISQVVPGTAYNPESTVTPLKNLYLLGDETAGNTAVMVAIGTVTGSNNSVVNVLFENIHIIGGSVGVNFVENTWMLYFLNCKCHAQNQYGLQFTGVTTAGEGIQWQGGAIANVTNSANTGVGLYFPQPTSNSNNQLDFTAFGTLIDGNDSALTLGQGTCDLIGCTFEGSSGTGAMFTVAAPTTGPQASLKVVGGSITTPGTLISILNISGGEGAGAKLDIDMELYGNSGITVVERTGNCTVDVNYSRIDFSGATSAAYPTIGSSIAGNYNGGFETGTTQGWSTQGTGITFTAQTSVVHSGTYAGEAVGATATGQVQFTVPCKPGQATLTDAWINVTAVSAGSVDVEVDFYDSTGTKMTSFTIVTYSAVTSGWVRNCLRWGVPAGAATAYYKVNMVGFTGTVYLDDSYMHVG